MKLKIICMAVLIAVSVMVTVFMQHIQTADAVYIESIHYGLVDAGLTY